VAVRALAVQAPARAWRAVAWRNGAHRAWRARFWACRVTPATTGAAGAWPGSLAALPARSRRHARDEVLLGQSADQRLAAVAGAAHASALGHRTAYAELKSELGLDDFVGGRIPAGTATWRSPPSPTRFCNSSDCAMDHPTHVPARAGGDDRYPHRLLLRDASGKLKMLLKLAEIPLRIKQSRTSTRGNIAGRRSRRRSPAGRPLSGCSRRTGPACRGWRRQLRRADEHVAAAGGGVVAHDFDGAIRRRSAAA